MYIIHPILVWIIQEKALLKVYEFSSVYTAHLHLTVWVCVKKGGLHVVYHSHLAHISFFNSSRNSDINISLTDYNVIYNFNGIHSYIDLSTADILKYLISSYLTKLIIPFVGYSGKHYDD